MAKNAARSGTQAVERAMLLLRVLASAGRRGMRVADICAAAALSQSTVSRILLALEREGMVERDHRTRRLFLGHVIHDLGLVARARLRMPELCREAMRELARITEDTIYLSEPSGSEAVCTAREDGAWPVKALPLHVGVRRPMGVGAGGLAILAALPPSRSAAILRRNAARYPAYGGIDLSLLQRGIEQARAQGWAHMANRATAGMAAIGVPLIGPEGEPVAALSIAAINSRMQPDREAWLAGLLGDHCRALTEQLQGLHQAVAG